MSREERRREDGKEEMRKRDGGKKDDGCYCGTPLTGW